MRSLKGGKGNSAARRQGNTLARVQEELVISEGTAITHRRNIYRKLDVHSKQELIDFVAGS